jgi:hypothetical protein
LRDAFPRLDPDWSPANPEVPAVDVTIGRPCPTAEHDFAVVVLVDQSHGIAEDQPVARSTTGARHGDGSEPDGAVRFFGRQPHEIDLHARWNECLLRRQDGHRRVDCLSEVHAGRERGAVCRFPRVMHARGFAKGDKTNGYFRRQYQGCFSYFISSQSDSMGFISNSIHHRIYFRPYELKYEFVLSFFTTSIFSDFFKSTRHKCFCRKNSNSL